jgi:hypothetical protein
MAILTIRVSTVRSFQVLNELLTYSFPLKRTRRNLTKTSNSTLLVAIRLSRKVIFLLLFQSHIRNQVLANAVLPDIQKITPRPPHCLSRQ